MIENMDKGLTVPKSVLIFRQKIPQTLPKCSAQFVCPSTKVWDFSKESYLWVSVVLILVAATPRAVKAAEEKRQKQAPNVGWFLLLQKGKQLHT